MHCCIEYIVVAGVQIGQVAIIYKRIMTNVKYLKHEFKSMQYIILKKTSYLVEYKCDVCCFIMMYSGFSILAWFHSVQSLIKVKILMKVVHLISADSLKK